MDLQQKKRLGRVLAFVGGGILLLVVYALFYNIVGFGWPCLFKTIFGLDCAGCGMTRAAGALLTLDVAGAFAYNAIWPLYLGYVLWALPAATIPYIKEGTPFGFPHPVWLNWVVLGVILAYGVVRNFI